MSPRIGVFGRPHHRHEDLRRADLTAARVNDRHGVAAVVDEQFLPGAMHLAHRARQAVAKDPVERAELAIGVRTLTVRDPVFLPQQLQGHPLALELLVDHGKLRPLVLLARGGLPEQQRLQARFIQILRQRPAQPLAHSPLYETAHRTLGYPGRRRDPLVT